MATAGKWTSTLLPHRSSDHHLPRTLKEIDDEIKRLEEHLSSSPGRKRTTSASTGRMTVVGGALLGLVDEAGAMLDAILQKIPKKERKPFGDPPRLPAQAARAACLCDRVSLPARSELVVCVAAGTQTARTRRPPQPFGRSAAADTAAAKGAAEGSTPTATSDRRRAPRRLVQQMPANERPFPFALTCRP